MIPNHTKIIGTTLTVVVSLLLLLDAGMKLAGVKETIEATGELGFVPSATRILGVVLAAATVIYMIPRTRILGAVLLTGYLGGAVAVQAQHGNPLLTHILFGAYVGVALWAAVWLGNAGLRSLLPIDSREVK